MRVLLLAQFYPPDVGGEERHVQGLGAALAARGHQVAVATQALNDDAGVSVEGGVEVHRFRSSVQRLGLGSVEGRPHLPPVPDPELSLAIARLVGSWQPDVLHAHNWIVNCVIATPTFWRVPLVLTLHDYGWVCPTHRLMYEETTPCSGPAPAKCLSCSSTHYGKRNGLVTAVSLRATKPLREARVSRIIAVSHAVAQLNRLDRGRTPFDVIPNFIPRTLTDAHDVKPDPDLPAGRFVVFVGDMTRDKGLPVLLEALPALTARGVKLVCIGGRLNLSTLPPDVIAPGSWPHDRVQNAVRQAEVAVVPSTWPDPCPTTVLEAMAAGTPLVASRVGGIIDMVEDGESGRLVDPADAAALGAALGDLLDDPALAAGLAKGAAERVHGFTDEAVVERVERVYAAAGAR